MTTKRIMLLAAACLALASCSGRKQAMANEIWSSDANYPAGSDPWSGTPTTAAPSLPEIAAGHTPGVPVPAETENWWKKRTDSRLLVLEIRPHVHGPAAFIRGNVNAFASGAMGGGGFNAPGARSTCIAIGGTAEFWSPIGYLPIGAKIDTIDVIVHDLGGAGAGKFVNFWFNRQKDDGSAIENVTVLAHELNGVAGWNTVSLAPAHVIADGYSYWLWMAIDDGGEVLKATVNPSWP